MADQFDFKTIENRVRTVLTNAPTVLGNEALNFFLDRFREQAWLADSLQRWANRKNPNKWGMVKNNNRSLLVLHARLKRSLRMSTRFGEATISTDVPYAKAHNEGLRLGVYQRVKSFHRRKKVMARTSTGKVRTRKGKPVKIFGTGAVTVGGFTRKVNMNIPKRQFMGKSPYLEKILNRRLSAELLKAFR